MGRPAVVQIEIIRLLESDPRQYGPSALAYATKTKVASVWVALNELLDRGLVIAAKNKQTGFVYRHKSTPSDAVLVEIKMARCLVVDGEPIKFLRK